MNTKTNGNVLDEAWRIWHVFGPYVRGKGTVTWASIEPKMIEVAKEILRAAEPQIHQEENEKQAPIMTGTEGPIDNLADEFMGALTGLDGLQGDIMGEGIEGGASIEKEVVAAKERIALALNLYVSACYLKGEQS